MAAKYTYPQRSRKAPAPGMKDWDRFHLTDNASKAGKIIKHGTTAPLDLIFRVTMAGKSTEMEPGLSDANPPVRRFTDVFLMDLVHPSYEKLMAYVDKELILHRNKIQQVRGKFRNIEIFVVWKEGKTTEVTEDVWRGIHDRFVAMSLVDGAMTVRIEVECEFA